MKIEVRKGLGDPWALIPYPSPNTAIPYAALAKQYEVIRELNYDILRNKANKVRKEIEDELCALKSKKV